MVTLHQESISTQVKITLGSLILTLINYRFTPGNSTNGNHTLGYSLDIITLGNLTLDKYTLVTFTLGTLL